MASTPNLSRREPSAGVRSIVSAAWVRKLSRPCNVNESLVVAAQPPDPDLAIVKSSETLKLVVVVETFPAESLARTIR